jgi:hypothetical protein
MMRLFLHKVSVIFNFQHTFANVEYDAAYQCCKIPCLDFAAHQENCVSIRRHLQNGVCVVHPLQDQTGERECQIWAVSRMGKKSPSNFCDCLTCAQTGVRSGIVVKEKDVFHVSVRTNCTDALSQFV